MNNLKDAKIVLRILKENNFDSYIVGGAVRDYILKRPLNDIDITTSAKPKDVLNLFKGDLTGAKYGTVTIKFKEATFEVTTFRSEKGYADFRHPEEINFEEDVIEDVKRRDFTINGLLMDGAGQIIDHVGGMKDLKHRFIRTIGDPNLRFGEDALRILRAFYFQGKLDFFIDKETLEGIKSNKDLLTKIPNERVIDELLKIIQSEYFKKALSSMVDTGVHEALPGLKLGMEFFVRQKEMPKVDIFFSTCFTLNASIPAVWKFSNKHRHKYQTVAYLANNFKTFTAKELYEYGLEFCQYANRVNFILGKDELRVLDLEKMFNDLPIKSNQDLKLRARDLLEFTNKKAGAWVNNLIKEMVVLVLEGKLKNNREELRNFVINNIERF